MKITHIYYWKLSQEICAEFAGQNNPDITIGPGGTITLEHEGEYYGPCSYLAHLDTYSLCSLIALYEEVYGK